ncbi:hypothetical protein AAEX28_15580 [Lentisphaerota bacterium WC36G]|nr:hypothetical protein LJT99_02340 [Lentisphaerae bacterium WC36]
MNFIIKLFVLCLIVNFNICCDNIDKKNVPERKADMIKMTFFCSVKKIKNKEIFISGFSQKQKVYATCIYYDENITFEYDILLKKYCFIKNEKNGFKEALQKNYIYFFDGQKMQKSKIKELTRKELRKFVDSDVNNFDNFESIKSFFIHN